MAKHNEIGKWGEQIAYEFLVKQGYAICEHNWRLNHLEVDIIAMKGNRIIFVEVKTRADDEIDPLLAVNKKKRANLIQAAKVYIESHKIIHDYQFDVIVVIGSPLSSLPPKIDFFPDAFLPPLRTYR
ncbi:MAG: YraN family protein [Muribaculaceae bacterium]|nr:YraN family protein [Muribaculaceae bacterium]